jgi:putative SOS response-associated peptidase YedK
MPLIIRKKEFELWIKSETPLDILKELIKPYSGNCIMHPVTTKVNNPAYNDPDCINPV